MVMEEVAAVVVALFHQHQNNNAPIIKSLLITGTVHEGVTLHTSVSIIGA